VISGLEWLSLAGVLGKLQKILRAFSGDLSALGQPPEPDHLVWAGLEGNGSLEVLQIIGAGCPNRSARRTFAVPSPTLRPQGVPGL
jgi:hypothetical protein